MKTPPTPEQVAAFWNRLEVMTPQLIEISWLLRESGEQAELHARGTATALEEIETRESTRWAARAQHRRPW